MSVLSCRVYPDDNGVAAKLEEITLSSLEDNEVLIDVHYSGINYKDALGVTGKGKIYRQLPITAGIDCAGTIIDPGASDFSAGQCVLVNGCGLGEVRDGGLASMVKVPKEWVIPMPEGLSPKSAMLFGTAGFTAALAIERMEQNGQSPELGPVVVTGASGGVGSFAVMMLSQLGYEVIAVTGREEHQDYLKSLGASTVTDLDGLELGDKPLERAKFGGVIDNLGGEPLAKLIPHVDLWGNVSCIGMAAGMSLNTNVFPFILRGVSLLGASSTNCPMPWRKKIWERMGRDFIKQSKLDLILGEEVALKDVMPCFESIINREHRGRILVNCQ